MSEHLGGGEAHFSGGGGERKMQSDLPCTLCHFEEVGNVVVKFHSFSELNTR
jgi:hypothetical protein